MHEHFIVKRIYCPAFRTGRSLIENRNAATPAATKPGLTLTMGGGRGGPTWERSRESLRLPARGSPTCAGEGRGRRPRSARVTRAAAALLGRPPRRPQLLGEPAPGGRGAGLRRLRAPPLLAKEEAGRAALRPSSCSREAPPGRQDLGAGDLNRPPRGPRCGEPTGAPRQRPPTCRERQLCQPVARRARRLAPPTCGAKERATSGRGAFPEDGGQSTPKFSLVQPDHRLPPKGLVGPLIG